MIWSCCMRCSALRRALWLAEAAEHSPPVWLRQLFTRASIQELHVHPHPQPEGIYFLILPLLVPSVWAVIHHRKYIVFTQQVCSEALRVNYDTGTHASEEPNSYSQWNMYEEMLELHWTLQSTVNICQYHTLLMIYYICIVELKLMMQYIEINHFFK